MTGVVLLVSCRQRWTHRGAEAKRCGVSRRGVTGLTDAPLASHTTTGRAQHIASPSLTSFPTHPLQLTCRHLSTGPQPAARSEQAQAERSGDPPRSRIGLRPSHDRARDGPHRPSEAHRVSPKPTRNVKQVSNHVHYNMGSRYTHCIRVTEQAFRYLPSDVEPG
jgi:hypothetical protein